MDTLSAKMKKTSLMPKWWKKRFTAVITESDPSCKVVYLGNVLTGWAKGNSIQCSTFFSISIILFQMSGVTDLDSIGLYAKYNSIVCDSPLMNKDDVDSIVHGRAAKKKAGNNAMWEKVDWLISITSAGNVIVKMFAS